MSDTVEFCGEQFKLASGGLGLMPMMRLARIQQRMDRKAAADISDAEGAELLVALLELIEQCIADDEAQRFEDVATVNRVGIEEIRGFANRAIEAISARPTERSSDSSDGPRIIEPNSTVDSSSPDMDDMEATIHRFNTQEHPRGDLALLVRKRRESLTA